MTPEETVAWVGALFPGTVTLAPVHPPNGGGIIPVARVEDEGDDVTTHMTVGVHGYDQGLVTEDGRELRSELFVRTVGDADAAAVLLAGCGAAIRDHEFEVRPGAMIRGVLPGAGESAPAHAVLVPPRVWEAGTPRIDDGEQVTTVLQVLPITESELVFGARHGSEMLLDALATAGVDFLDLRRTSAF